LNVAAANAIAAATEVTAAAISATRPRAGAFTAEVAALPSDLITRFVLAVGE
jgi:hypothetical protein